MMDLSIELRYLVADGRFKNSKLVVFLAALLEACARAEDSDTGSTPNR